jgi:serine/threonine protein kinase/TolB-like protein/Tfp pilus assembly protein PilF
MMRDKLQRVEELFHRAAALPIAERLAFLESSDEDPGVRAEVQLLLQHDLESRGTVPLSEDFPALAEARRLLEGAEETPGGLAGQRIGDFTIAGEIGRGGMGTVYEAFQEPLARRVAFKVLPATLALDPVRLERFRREARAMARIRHPNIVQVHEIGEWQSTLYYVMELIDGASLQSILAAARGGRRDGDAEGAIGVAPAASGPPGPEEALRAAERMAELAEGLEQAHAQGLVHRDIKPSNILVRRDGSYVLADFGLVRDAADESLTKSGQLLGTLSYMSPEQLCGRDVDARSDVYSLGVTLFELLTLTRPFEGDSAGELQQAVLREEPPSPRRSNPKLDPCLATIVLRCLEKDPERRYASAGELAADLRRFCRGEPTIARPLPAWEWTWRRAWRRRKQVLTALFVAALLALSAVFLSTRTAGPIAIAILPFANESQDPGAEYITESVPERLRTLLGAVPAFRVKSRNALLRYQGSEVDPLEAGRKLDVDIVLSGRLVEQAEMLALMVKLIDVRGGQELWETRYDRALGDLEAAEEEICRQIASRLRISLFGGADGELRKRHTANPQADIAYRRGRLLYSKQTPESLARSIPRFEEALALDPSFALAHIGLAEAWLALAYFQHPGELYAKARGFTEQALALDPRLGEAHAALGSLQLYQDWNWEAAARSLDRALELNPRCVESFPCFVHIRDVVGEFESAVAYVRLALRYDPESAALQHELGCTLYYAGRYEDSVEQSLEALEMDASLIFAYYNVGRSYGQLGRFEESIATLEKARDLTAGEWNEILAELAHSYARAGRTAEAEAIRRELLERKQTDFVDPYPLAFAHMGLEDKESALAALEEALDILSTWAPWLKVEPKFFRLHSEPRFQALLERLKL